MIGKTHRAAGLLIAAAMVPASIHLTDKAQLLNTAVIIAGSFYGSLVPDIDIEKSTGRNEFILTSCLFDILQKIEFFLRKKNVLFCHRGIMHSILIPLLSMAAAILLTANTAVRFFLFSFAFGFLSHIFLDLLSSGVNLFAPFYNKRIMISRIRTGKKLDSVIRGLCYASMACVLTVRFQLITNVIELANRFGIGM